MGLKERIKREAGFMKLGAKRLPSVAGQKVKGWAKGQWEQAKQRAIMEREMAAEEKRAELESYRQARLEAARVRGIKRGAARASSGGILGQLGQIGENISVSDTLGFGDLGKQRKGKAAGMGSSGSFIFDGLGQMPTDRSARMEIHHYHHHSKKKRRQ